MSEATEKRIRKYGERLDAGAIHVLAEADRLAGQMEALAVAARGSGRVTPAEYALLIDMAKAAGRYLIARGEDTANRAEYYRLLAERNRQMIAANEAKGKAK